MCTLAIFREVSARYPLVVAANRDEFYERPATPPAPLADLPGVFAGTDLEAGGTWLGCRIDGRPFVAGLLNRRPAGGSGAAPHGLRSRGLLCMDALGFATVEQALERIGDEQAAAHGPFNLLVADAERAAVLDNRDGLNTTELSPGLSVLTNLDVNDPRCPRLAGARRRFDELAGWLRRDPEPAELVAAVAEVLRDHEGSADPGGDDPFARICVHAGAYGTRSSSIVLYDEDGAPSWHHADGPPCLARFEPLLG